MAVLYVQGYVIHEAACWSPRRREWVFLPRRVSSLPYDEDLDEKMGSNKIVIADENFKKVGNKISYCWLMEEVLLPRNPASFSLSLFLPFGTSTPHLQPCTQLTVREAGNIIPEHGFSSFKFLPGTNDEVIVALKSVEEAATQKQSTYLVVFTIDGQVLLEETLLPSLHKFEGLEFV